MDGSNLDLLPIQKEETVSLSKVPKKWIKLSKYNNKNVIFNPCDGDNKKFEIKEVQSKWQLIESLGQETAFYEILETKMVKSDLVIKAIDKYSNDIHTFTLSTYKPESKVINWKWSYREFDFDYKYVNENGISDFKTINQPCKECWDDEICDEKEESNKIINNTYPKWLIELYESDIDLPNDQMTQKIVDFKQVNDSVTFSIQELSTGTCLTSFLTTQIHNIETEELEISDECDHDLSQPKYSWKIFKFKESLIIQTTEYTEYVHDSLIDSDGFMKDGYDFIEVDTKIDSIISTYKITDKGKITKSTE